MTPLLLRQSGADHSLHQVGAEHTLYKEAQADLADGQYLPGCMALRGAGAAAVLAQNLAC